MRKLVLIPAVALAVLSMAPAAHAKEPGEATVTGPGLAVPIRFDFEGDGDDGAESFFTLLDKSGLWAAYKPAERPKVELGPRYVVTVVWGDPVDPTGENVFHLYPYAEGQPRSYTPEQASDMNTPGAKPGWYTASPVVLDLLVRNGLPETAPVGFEPSGARPVSAPASGPPVGWILASGALGAMLLLGAIASRPRRRGRVIA
jgi:hypothetical protein